MKGTAAMKKILALALALTAVCGCAYRCEMQQGELTPEVPEYIFSNGLLEMRVVPAVAGRINGLSKVVDINYVFESKTEAASADKPKGCKARVTCKMNYREGPSTKSDIVGTYKKGKKIYIKKFKGNWAKMTNGYYINRSNLKYTAKTKDNVNYRKGPGVKYKRLGTYKPGKVLTIVKVKDGWAKTSNGKWLAVKYTKIQ